MPSSLRDEITQMFVSRGMVLRNAMVTVGTVRDFESIKEKLDQAKDEKAFEKEKKEQLKVNAEGAKSLVPYENSLKDWETQTDKAAAALKEEQDKQAALKKSLETLADSIKKQNEVIKKWNKDKHFYEKEKPLLKDVDMSVLDATTNALVDSKREIDEEKELIAQEKKDLKSNQTRSKEAADKLPKEKFTPKKGKKK